VATKTEAEKWFTVKPSKKEFDANFANLRKFKSIWSPFAANSEIRVTSLSVSIRFHPWLNCRPWSGP